MTQPHVQVDFDKNPPMPLTAYEDTVRKVNVGYDQTFLLTESFLRALGKPDLHLLVVGAGGGAEIERFLPRNPGWRITGLDPSDQMLAQARAKTQTLALDDRVTLALGTVERLAPDALFDAATCLYVLHFLPDAAKVETLRAIRDHLRPSAPLYLVSGVRPAMMESAETDSPLRSDMLGAWQRYGELMGMPADQMAAIIAQLVQQMEQPQAATASRIEDLMREAGFTHIAPYYMALSAIYGWIAR